MATTTIPALPEKVVFKAPPPAFSDIAKASNDVSARQCADARRIASC
jgi:hypothetical protein